MLKSAAILFKTWHVTQWLFISSHLKAKIYIYDEETEETVGNCLCNWPQMARMEIEYNLKILD